MGSSTRCRSVNNGRQGQCRNPLWEERTKGNISAASWAVTRWTPGMLLIRERKTPYLLKGEYRGNGNSGTSWVYTFLVVAVYSIYEVGLDMAEDLFFAVSRGGKWWRQRLWWGWRKRRMNDRGSVNVVRDESILVEATPEQGSYRSGAKVFFIAVPKERQICR